MIMTSSRFEKKDRLFDPNTEDLARCEIGLHRSDDGGDAWSAPQIVPVPLDPERYTWNGAGSLLQLAPDRWMYPFETWKPEGYVGIPDQKGAALFSSDQGESWGEYTVVADDTSQAKPSGGTRCAPSSPTAASTPSFGPTSTAPPTT